MTISTVQTAICHQIFVNKLVASLNYGLPSQIEVCPAIQNFSEKKRNRGLKSKKIGKILLLALKVVLVPFTFDDLSSSKVRPAVCLTDPVGPHLHVIMAFVSSRMSIDQLETDMILKECKEISL